MATKITCAASDCVFCNDKFRCTADKVQLAENDIMTMWDGRQRYNRCLTYQKSERAKQFENAFKDLVEMMKNGPLPQYPTESMIDESRID